MNPVYRKIPSLTIYRKNSTAIVSKNTFTDFHLIPFKNLQVNFAEPKYAVFPMSGTSERRDVTAYLPNGLSYSNRTGSWEFYIDHSDWKDWITAFDVITEFINGAKVDVVIDEKPSCCYSGYLEIEKYNPGSSYSYFTIKYDLDYEKAVPYGYYPVRFIHSDGTYDSLEYVFPNGGDYVVEFGDPVFGKRMKRLLLNTGIYSGTELPQGNTIDISNTGEPAQMAVLSVSSNGRFSWIAGRIGDLIALTKGLSLNFGSDGIVGTFTGNGSNGISFSTNKMLTSEILVTVELLPETKIINAVSYNVSSVVDLSNVLANDILIVTFSYGGRHSCFVGTKSAIVSMNRGAVLNFGSDGEILTIMGNGINGFTFETTVNSIISVNICVSKIQNTAIHDSVSVDSGNDISLASVSQDQKILIASIYSSGRAFGFCATNYDIFSSEAGAVFNFGNDGEIAEIKGDGYSAFTLSSSAVSDFSVAIGELSYSN